MKHSLIVLYLLLFSCGGYSQITECSGIPMSYDTNSVLFETAIPASFGDSMLTFNITNTHPSQAFAYPLAKLVPLTPLPSGMSLAPNNNPWSVFASSWNPAVTMPVHIFYNITSPIPVNYTVIYEVWVSNLIPLPIDSCYFTTTFTVNLNPSPLSVNEFENAENDFSLFPSPANNVLTIKAKNKISYRKIFICSINGEQVMEVNSENSGHETQINVNELQNGLYLLKIQSGNKLLTVKKFTVLKN